MGLGQRVSESTIPKDKASEIQVKKTYRTWMDIAGKKNWQYCWQYGWIINNIAGNSVDSAILLKLNILNKTV